MSAAAELRIEGIGKRYGQQQVLDDINVTVPQGSYVVLLGPSGSGKTTLLSILGGFTTPGSGRVLLGGRDITLSQPAQRPTATVFQDYALFPHLTIAQNVGFGLSVRKVARAEMDHRVADALRLVGLEGFGSRPIAAASGGQRQRIALARALVIEPSLLLLDEPLGALDLSLRRQMQEELRRIQRSQGRTFVHVTHDQEEAMAIADLVIIMNHGRIEDMGAPERIYQSPRTRFAARFLGESTVLDGTVLSSGDGVLAVETVCGKLPLPGTRAVGSKVSVALRPEAIRPGPAGASDIALGLLRITDTVYQGSFVRVTGMTTSGTAVLAKIEHAHAGSNLTSASGPVEFSVRHSGLVLLED
jgi:spermidine/putrescine transport system ATP-binding protein